MCQNSQVRAGNAQGSAFRKSALNQQQASSCTCQARVTATRGGIWLVLSAEKRVGTMLARKLLSISASLGSAWPGAYGKSVSRQGDSLPHPLNKLLNETA